MVLKIFLMQELLQLFFDLIFEKIPEGKVLIVKLLKDLPLRLCSLAFK